MKKEELVRIIDECLIDAWKKYQDSRGITEGDISPEDSLSWDELMGQIADFIMEVSNHNLPTFLDDEEKMADFNRLTKDEFLSMYSYISEEEYDHTKEMKEFLDEEKALGDLKEKLKSLFNEKKISYEWTGSMGHEDCVSFKSEAFMEQEFHIYIPKMAWEGIEDVFVEKLAKYIEIGELHLVAVHIADSTSVPEYDFDETCPHCNHVNKIIWDKKSHSTVCEGCGKKILLCNLCDMDTATCGKCPYEKELQEKKALNRIIKIKNTYGTEDKYVLQKEYAGFGIYQEKTPSGYFVHQSWLISNNEDAELVIESYNDQCEEELLNIIDIYNNTGKFGVKAVMHCGSLHMHSSGKMV